MIQELRYALRTLKNNPSFAAVAVLTRALGVGPNAARIVQLNTSQKGRSFPRLTGPDFVDIRSDASALEQVSFYYGGEMGVQMIDHAEFAGTHLVTPNFFSVFGVAPAFGRAFDKDDAQR